MATQAPGAVVLIRPQHFRSNPQTNGDNTFHSWSSFVGSQADLATAVYDTSTAVAKQLIDVGVDVHLFEDKNKNRPDSIFVNNWLSTHDGGRLAIYPMYARNRRAERRVDIVEFLKRNYRVQEVVDFSGLEHDDVYLEGTGTMVLDHVGRIAYTARSRRADPRALERFCHWFGYEPVLFDAQDRRGAPIYHTNIAMCVGTSVALVGLDSIADSRQRAVVLERLESTGRTVVPLSCEQLAQFAGNAIELRGSSANWLAMSARGVASLTPGQIEVIEDSCRLLPLDVGPVELAGGSVRCMIAGVHLERRPRAAIPKPRNGQPVTKLAAA